jgi:hypothetical protein
MLWSHATLCNCRFVKTCKMLVIVNDCYCQTFVKCKFRVGNTWSPVSMVRTVVTAFRKGCYGFCARCGISESSSPLRFLPVAAASPWRPSHPVFCIIMCSLPKHMERHLVCCGHPSHCPPLVYICIQLLVRELLFYEVLFFFSYVDTCTEKPPEILDCGETVFFFLWCADEFISSISDRS